VSCPCRCTRPLARAGNRPCGRAGGDPVPHTPAQEQRPYECFAQTRVGLPPAQADLFTQTHQPLARPVEQLALVGNSPLSSAARSYRSQHSRARRASSRPSGSRPPSSSCNSALSLSCPSTGANASAMNGRTPTHVGKTPRRRSTSRPRLIFERTRRAADSRFRREPPRFRAPGARRLDDVHSCAIVRPSDCKAVGAPAKHLPC
jgi:hypothetical protein